MCVKVLYKHSLGDPEFSDDQMFASLNDLDDVFDALADKCLFYRDSGSYDGEGNRILIYSSKEDTKIGTPPRSISLLSKCDFLH
jgi:hypothetical protein